MSTCGWQGQQGNPWQFEVPYGSVCGRGTVFVGKWGRWKGEGGVQEGREQGEGAWYWMLVERQVSE